MKIYKLTLKTTGRILAASLFLITSLTSNAQQSILP